VVCGAEKRVASILDRPANDHPVFDAKLGNTLLTLPAIQRCSIEQVNRFGRAQVDTRGRYRSCGNDSDDHLENLRWKPEA
jgi:hypothetical protein